MPVVKKEILAAIEGFKNIEVDLVLLNEVKQRLKYSFALGMDNPDAIANAVSLYVWVTGDPEALNKSYELFESVTPKDIQRVANKYLVESGMTVGTISPEDKPVLN